MLNHSTIQHARRDIPPPAFLLQVVEALQNDTFPVREPIFHIREIVTRVTSRHRKVFPRRVYPKFRAECCGGTWRSSSMWSRRYTHALCSTFSHGSGCKGSGSS